MDVRRSRPATLFFHEVIKPPLRPLPYKGAPARVSCERRMGASRRMTRWRQRRGRISLGPLRWFLLFLAASSAGGSTARADAAADGGSATAAGTGDEGGAAKRGAVNLLPVKSHNPAGVLNGIHVRLPQKVSFVRPQQRQIYFELLQGTPFFGRAPQHPPGQDTTRP
jgi:hypothetical protein